MKRLLVTAVVVATVAAGCGSEERSGAPGAASAENPKQVAAPAPAEPVPSEQAPAIPTTPMPDPTGAYFPMSDLPAPFAELEHLLVATIDENGATAPLNGFLRPKAASANDYKLVKPVLEDRKLTFTTSEVDGVSYAFDGLFDLPDDFPQNPPSHETSVLAGTLTKMQNGKKVAETPVQFRYVMGD